MTLKCEYCGGYRPDALAEFGITMKATAAKATQVAVEAAATAIRREIDRIGGLKYAVRFDVDDIRSIISAHLLTKKEGDDGPTDNTSAS